MRQLFRPSPGSLDYRAPRLGGGASSGGYQYIPQPAPVQQDDSAQQEAARKERLADAKSIGRSATILTDYALAMKSPSVLKPTLGA